MAKKHLLIQKNAQQNTTPGLESSRKTPNNPSGAGQYQHLNRDLRSSLNDQTGPSPIGLLSTYSALENPPKVYSLH